MTRTARPEKHSFTIAGHQTSISLERPFWDLLREIADHQGRPIRALIEEIDASREESGLSSAIRVWLLRYVRERSNLG